MAWLLLRLRSGAGGPRDCWAPPTPCAAGAWRTRRTTRCGSTASSACPVVPGRRVGAERAAPAPRCAPGRPRVDRQLLHGIHGHHRRRCGAAGPAAPRRTHPPAGAGRSGPGRLTFALGMGLAAPLVTVVYFGTKHASPGRFTGFEPVAGQDLLARLLPTTYSFGTPAVYVGITALVLALALPFHRAVPRRWRRMDGVGDRGDAVDAVDADPSVLARLHHPQGSPYREAFVLCALLVIAAWYALSYGPPDRRALIAASVLLALITALASRSGLVRSFAWPVLALAAAGTLAGLALYAGTQRGRLATGGHRALLVGCAVALLVCTQLGETTATTAAATRMRLSRMDDYAPGGRASRSSRRRSRRPTAGPVPHGPGPGADGRQRPDAAGRPGCPVLQQPHLRRPQHPDHGARGRLDSRGAICRASTTPSRT